MATETLRGKRRQPSEGISPPPEEPLKKRADLKVDPTDKARVALAHVGRARTAANCLTQQVMRLRSFAHPMTAAGALVNTADVALQAVQWHQKILDLRDLNTKIESAGFKERPGLQKEYDQQIDVLKADMGKMIAKSVNTAAVISSFMLGPAPSVVLLTATFVEQGLNMPAYKKAFARFAGGVQSHFVENKILAAVVAFRQTLTEIRRKEHPSREDTASLKQAAMNSLSLMLYGKTPEQRKAEDQRITREIRDKKRHTTLSKVAITGLRKKLEGRLKEQRSRHKFYVVQYTDPQNVTDSSDQEAQQKNKYALVEQSFLRKHGALMERVTDTSSYHARFSELVQKLQEIEGLNVTNHTKVMEKMDALEERFNSIETQVIESASMASKATRAISAYASKAFSSRSS